VDLCDSDIEEIPEECDEGNRSARSPLKTNSFFNSFQCSYDDSYNLLFK
jgi:hypothetical protein